MTGAFATYQITGQSGGAPIIDGNGTGPVLLTNLDPNNTVYLSDIPSTDPGNPSINAPLPPLSAIVFDDVAPVYAATAIGQTATVGVVPGGLQFFNSNIIAKSLIAGNTIINANGIFIYFPTKAFNNLILSSAPQAGVDQFGNQYVDGETVYGLFAGFFFALQMRNAQLQWLVGGPTEASPYNIAFNLGAGAFAAGVTPPTFNIGGPQLGGMVWNTGGPGNSQLAFVVSSGDVTGVKDTAAFHGAFTTFGINTVIPLPGEYWVISGNVTIGWQQMLDGLNKSGVIIHAVDNAAVGTKPVFNIENNNPLVYKINQNAGIRNLSIDGTGTTKSNAIEFGDIVGIELDELDITNFPTTIGLYCHNRTFFTEQLRGKVYVSNCGDALVLDATAPGTNSMDRWDFNLWLNAQDGQNGVHFKGGAIGTSMGNGHFGIFGNFASNVGGGTVVLFDSTNGAATGFLACELNIGVEANLSGANVQPTTIKWIGNQGSITQCYGQMYFGGGGFLPSNNNGNMEYDGLIFGDDTLREKAFLFGVTQVSAGFPAGWTGFVSAEKMANTSLIYLNHRLQIANGTNITNGETITNLGPLYRSIDNVFWWANLNGVLTQMIIQPSGNVQYLGPTQVLGAIGFLYGQVVYSNSY